MSGSRQLRTPDRRAGTPRRAYPGDMGRPSLVRTLDDLDSDLVAAAQAVWPAGGEVLWIFDVPPQEFPSWAKYRYGPRNALIFTSAGVIHGQTAARGQPAQARLAPTAAVYYVQVSELLLYGRLEIGYAADGQAQQMVLEFNTVGWDVLRPALRELLRNASVLCPPPPVAAQAPEFSMAEIRRLPFRYANGVMIYLLAPGERPQALAFQPGIWTRRLLIFRRQVTPAIVLALTDRHVSLIEEERSLTTKPSYGWTFTFIPRHGVTGMRSEPAPLGRLVSIEMLVEGAKAMLEVEATSEVAAAWGAQWRAHGGGWSDADEISDSH
jgi:hypothetical protein